MAYTYKRDVEFRCSVRADPELKEISWLWYEKDGKTNRTLKPYEWRSLYHTSLEKGVSLYHTTLKKGISLYRSILKTGVSLYRKTLEKGVSLYHTSLEKGVSLYHTTLEKGLVYTAIHWKRG